MFLSAGDPEVYPDLSGEPDAKGELSSSNLALLRQVEVEIPESKRPKKPKGPRSKPKRGHKKPTRRKNKKSQGG